MADTFVRKWRRWGHASTPLQRIRSNFCDPKMIALCVFLLYIKFVAIPSASSGVGGAGVANVFVQCIFKSFANVDDFQKTGEEYTSLHDLLSHHDTTEIDASYYSSDMPTDKASRHNYTDYYDIVLSKFYTKHINLLEFGVKKGGSIKMWRELFSFQSRIFGIDIDPGIPSFSQDANIKTMVSDSLSPLATSLVKGLTFDVIVDDGNHEASAQLSTLANFLPFLNPNGVYIVEDVYHWADPGISFRDDVIQACGGIDYQWYRFADKSDLESVVFIFRSGSESLATLTKKGLMNSGYLCKS
jgi:hypothetical protein